MIQHSANLLKYMTNQNSIELDQINLIWDASQRNEKPQRLAVYKALSDIALYLRDEQIEVIINKMTEIPINAIGVEEVELVYQLCKHSRTCTTWLQRTVEFYLKTIRSISTEETIKLALNHFSSLLSSRELKEDRFQVILECVVAIEKETCALPSIRIMNTLIEDYPIDATDNERHTNKRNCVDYLVSQEGLLKLLIKDIIEFKSKVKKQRIESKESSAVDNTAKLDKLFGDNGGYLNHIEERLSFIFLGTILLFFEKFIEPD